MGNYILNINNNNHYEYDECLKYDRLIDGENKIYIGIVAKKPLHNLYSSQAIRIGEYGKLKRLENFIETPNSLIFKYESNTSMILSKRENDIIINIEEMDTNLKIIKPMDSIVKQIFKPIKFGNSSIEYDKIPIFIKPKLEDIQTNLDE